MDSDDSEIDSELEDLLYSQIHYSTELNLDEASESILSKEINVSEHLNPDVEQVIEKEAESSLLLPKEVEEKKDAWHINEKDKEGAEKYNKSLSRKKRYYVDKQETGLMCYNCNTRGHFSRECPEPAKPESCHLCGIKGHHRNACPNDVCYNCYDIGHISKTCSAPRKSFYLVCKRCWGRGHNKSTCPEIWRQYHLTVEDNGKIVKPKVGRNGVSSYIRDKRFCYNCGAEGHFGTDCHKHRPSRRGVNSPFVVYYDKCPYKPKSDSPHAEDSSSKKSARDSEERSIKRSKKRKAATAEDNEEDASRSKGLQSKPVDRDQEYANKYKRLRIASEEYAAKSARRLEGGGDKTERSVVFGEKSKDEKSKERSKDLITISSSDDWDSNSEACTKRLMNKDKKNDDHYEMTAQLKDDGNSTIRKSNLPIILKRNKNRVGSTDRQKDGKKSVECIVLSTDTEDSSREIQNIAKKGKVVEVTPADSRKRKAEEQEDKVDKSTRPRKRLSKGKFTYFKDAAYEKASESEKALFVLGYIDLDVYSADSGKNTETGVINKDKAHNLEEDFSVDDFIELDVFNDFSDEVPEINNKQERIVEVNIASNKETNGRDTHPNIDSQIDSKKIKAKDRHKNQNNALESSKKSDDRVKQGNRQAKDVGNRNIIINSDGLDRKSRYNYRQNEQKDGSSQITKKGEFVEVTPSDTRKRKAEEHEGALDKNTRPRKRLSKDAAYEKASESDKALFVMGYIDLDVYEGVSDEEPGINNKQERLMDRYNARPNINSQVDSKKIKANGRDKNPSNIHENSKKPDRVKHGHDTRECFKTPQVSVDSRKKTLNASKSSVERNSRDLQSAVHNSAEAADGSFKKARSYQDSISDKITTKDDRPFVRDRFDQQQNMSERFGDNAGNYTYDNINANSQIAVSSYTGKAAARTQHNNGNTFANADTNSDDEDFQFSNLLSHNADISSDDGDLRSTINTLKATRQQKGKRTGKATSPWNESVTNRTEAATHTGRQIDNHDAISGIHDQASEDQRNIDLTRYNPNEAIDDHLSYYGMNGTPKQTSQIDDRFKKPKHIIFVEHDEVDSDENAASVPVRVMKKSDANKLKAERLENARELTQEQSCIEERELVDLDAAEDDVIVADTGSNANKAADGDFRSVLGGLLRELKFSKKVVMKRLSETWKNKAKGFMETFQRKNNRKSKRKVLRDWKDWICENEDTMLSDHPQSQSNANLSADNSNDNVASLNSDAKRTSPGSNSRKNPRKNMMQKLRGCVEDGKSNQSDLMLEMTPSLTPRAGQGKRKRGHKQKNSQQIADNRGFNLSAGAKTFLRDDYL